MRRAVSLVLLMLALGACASAAGSASGGNPNVITAEQLRELDSQGLSAYEVIQRLRPTWLRSRGNTSFQPGTGPAGPRAVVDGVPYGALEDLNGVRAVEVEVMEFLGAGDATTRFGTGYVGGAVLVRTR